MIEILKPGLLSSVQDLGRIGYQKYGVIVSGVMDHLAHRLANVIVGNPEEVPTLEFTLLGPQLLFKEDALIAICGGDLSPTINGKHVRTWRAIYVKKGSELSFGPCRSGCRAYLAVAGGFDIPKVMGSASTYIRAGIGGFEGRALQAGDELPFGVPSRQSTHIISELRNRIGTREWVESDWSLNLDLVPKIEETTTIRVIEGREIALFDEDSIGKFFSETFLITPQSDRMGYRLNGPQLKMTSEAELISEAVNFGTIQIPAGGQPIILLADRQTMGGYPKIAQVISTDFHKVAQLKPGDKIKFEKVSLEKAQKSFLERETYIKQLKMAIALRTN